MKIKEYIKKIFYETTNKEYRIVHKKTKVPERQLRDWKIHKEIKNKYMYLSNEEGYYFEEMIDIISTQINKEYAIYVYEDKDNQKIFIGFSNSLEKTEVIIIRNEGIADKIISILKVYSYKYHIILIKERVAPSKEYIKILEKSKTDFFFNGIHIIEPKEYEIYTIGLPYNATLVTRVKKYFKDYGKVAILSMSWLLPLYLGNQYLNEYIKGDNLSIKEKISENQKERVKSQKKMLFLTKEINTKIGRYEGIKYD